LSGIQSAKSPELSDHESGSEDDQSARTALLEAPEQWPLFVMSDTGGRDPRAPKIRLGYDNLSPYGGDDAPGAGDPCIIRKELHSLLTSLPFRKDLGVRLHEETGREMHSIPSI
jgi:hypothetical protein